MLVHVHPGILMQNVLLLKGLWRYDGVARVLMYLKVECRPRSLGFQGKIVAAMLFSLVCWWVMGHATYVRVWLEHMVRNAGLLRGIF